MSLILEALKKSEAERRLGETPSLSTVPNWKARSGPSRAWWLLLPALAIAVAAGWHNRDLLSDTPIAGDNQQAQADATKAPVTAAPVASEAPIDAAAVDSGADIAVPGVRAIKPGPPPVVASTTKSQPMPEPVPPPQSVEDVDAMRDVSPENQRRIRSGELFVQSPALLAERGPTKEEPIVTAESALPPPLPEPSEVDSMAMPASEPVTAPPVPSQSAATTAPANATQTSDAISVPAPVLDAVPAPQDDAVVGSGAQSIITIHDLTLSQRQGMPALKMSVHVYHRDVARRFAIIDGKRVNENGVIGGDTWAREIVPEGVIIEYKDTRFLLPRLGG